MPQSKVHRECLGPVALLTLDGPPVNAFNLGMRRELHDALQWTGADRQVKAVVITGSGRGFSAGGDIREFGTAEAGALPGLSSHIHIAIERSRKPVIAVVQGFALGGGLETVLASHYRVAETDAWIGLPEVTLGTLPLSATQRLPRLLGLVPAVRLMIQGQREKVSAFYQTALFDRVVDSGQGVSNACAWAAEMAASPLCYADLKRRLVRSLPIPGNDLQQDLIEARQLLQGRTDAASHALLQAVQAAVDSPDFDAGLACARRLYDQLMSSEALLHGRDRFLAGAPETGVLADHKAQ